MKYTFPIDKKQTVCAQGTFRVSTKKAVIVSRKINGKSFEYSKKFLNDIMQRKRSISGKYYDSAAKNILKLLESAEANAVNRGFELKGTIVHISASKGRRLLRSRRKRDFGLEIKSSNIKVVLERKENQAKKEKGE